MGWCEREETINNSFEKRGFGNPNVVADETFDHEFEEILQEFSSDITIEEFLEFDVNTSSVLRWTYHLLIGEKNYELNVSSQLPIKMFNLTTIALNRKTMKKMQWKSIQNQQWILARL